MERWGSGPTRDTERGGGRETQDAERARIEGPSQATYGARQGEAVGLHGPAAPTRAATVRGGDDGASPGRQAGSSTAIFS